VTEIICGVDVSKRRLDAHVAPTGAFESFSNDGAGIAELAAFCRRHGVALVAMEATVPPSCCCGKLACHAV